MPRIPSLRRPTLDAMRKNVERINRRMDREPDSTLTEEERAALVDAAKVGALLERMKTDEDEKEETGKPASTEAAAARLARLEQTTPAMVKREAPDGDHDE